MKYTEEATFFVCAGHSLLGIFSRPKAVADTGVIVLVGGPQYRVGSHRQFVLLSRTLASAGYPVLRFDYRGMGDSEGEARGFQEVSGDIEAAIDAMQNLMPSVKNVILWGLCDGASAALLYCQETHDPRVTGLCLLNPWVRSEASLARTQVKHYYRQRLMQKAFWSKLLHGGVAFQAVAGLLRNVHVALTGKVDAEKDASSPGLYQQRMAFGWNTFGGRIFLLLSEDDYTAKEFLDFASNDAAWKNSFYHPHLLRHDLQGADHTFSSIATREEVEVLTLEKGLSHFVREPIALSA